ncbi:MAG: TauD/TfdA family dioxygenase [Vicinamibacterales bacterium]
MASAERVSIHGGVGTLVDRRHGTDPLDVDRAWLISEYERTGAIFFSGFDASLQAFEELSASMMTGLFTNRGAAFSFGPFKRAAVNDDATVMTATGQRQDFPLPLHGEFYYFRHPPRMIWFYCAKPAPEGGETTIGDGRAALDALKPATADLVRRRGIRFERYLADGDWQVAFQTSDRDEVLSICRENATTVTWGADGSLLSEYYCRAVVVDGQGQERLVNGVLPVALGEQVIVSGQIAAIAPEMANQRPSLVVRWDDGSPLEPSVVQDLLAATAKVEIPVPARAGDILAIDNTRVMHGRRASTAVDRKVLVRMGAPNF